MVSKLWPISLLLTLLLTACSAAQPAWRENAPVSLPHTAASVQAITLTIGAANSGLNYQIACGTVGSYQNVALAVTLNTAPTTAITNVRDVACTSNQQIVAQGNLSRLDARQIGDTVTFALTAEANPLQQGIAKQDIVYMVGSNGSLHEGAGSVWQDTRPWWQRP